MFFKRKSLDNAIPNRLDTLSSEIANISEHLSVLDKLVLELIEDSGGQGWVELVQNAVKNLDTRVLALEAVLHRYGEMFEQIAKDLEEINDEIDIVNKEDIQ